MANGAQILQGCPIDGSSTMLTGSVHGRTQRVCRANGHLIEHQPPPLEPGQHGYASWGPQQVLSKEFEGEK